jgi:hypothetical protein
VVTIDGEHDPREVGLPAARLRRRGLAWLVDSRNLTLLATLAVVGLAMVSTWLPLVDRRLDHSCDCHEHWRLAEAYAWVPLAAEAVLAVAELLRGRRLGWGMLAVVIHVLAALECVVALSMSTAVLAGPARSVVFAAHVALVAVLGLRALAFSARVSFRDTHGMLGADDVVGEPLGLRQVRAASDGSDGHG